MLRFTGKWLTTKMVYGIVHWVSDQQKNTPNNGFMVWVSDQQKNNGFMVWVSDQQKTMILWCG